MQPDELVEVTQEDRLRAVALHKALRPHLPQRWITQMIEGHCDGDRVLQHLARHRQAAIAARPVIVEECAKKARNTMVAELSGLNMESPYRAGIKWCGERICDAIRGIARGEG